MLFVSTIGILTAALNHCQTVKNSAFFAEKSHFVGILVAVLVHFLPKIAFLGILDVDFFIHMFLLWQFTPSCIRL